MKNELKVFSNEDFGEMRLLIRGEEYWFIASELSNILGYSETSKMLRRLDDDEKLKIAPPKIGDTNPMAREITIINESGFYNAVIGSKMPKAKEFKKWVTADVLPTIRKTGGYVNSGNEEDFIKNYFPSFSDEVKQAMVLDLKKQNEEYKRQLEEQKHKVDFANSINFSKASIAMKEFADLLNIKKFGRNTMMEWLRKKEFINKKNEPYRQYIDMGIFETKEKVVDIGNGKTKMQITTYITGKGQTYLYDKISKDIAV